MMTYRLMPFPEKLDSLNLRDMVTDNRTYSSVPDNINFDLESPVYCSMNGYTFLHKFVNAPSDHLYITKLRNQLLMGRSSVESTYGTALFRNRCDIHLPTATSVKLNIKKISGDDLNKQYTYKQLIELLYGVFQDRPIHLNESFVFVIDERLFVAHIDNINVNMKQNNKDNKEVKSNSEEKKPTNTASARTDDKDKITFRNMTFPADHPGAALINSTLEIRAKLQEMQDRLNKEMKSNAIVGEVDDTVDEVWITADKTHLQVDIDDSIKKFFEQSVEYNELSRMMGNDIDFTELGIGGLNRELRQIFRRAFVSRMFSSSTLKKLNCSHVKGILLYGPPGTGKTLIARKIGNLLKSSEPKIVNGPEIFNKWVGESERILRELFKDAYADVEGKKLHIVIFDEIDSICKKRVDSESGASDVRNNVINQLLAIMDGVNSPKNLLIIGMTNRLDILDPAILRPGRFEVQLEISLPNEKGRHDIFIVHTGDMRKNKILAADVNLEQLAKDTPNYTGAEIAGIVRSAISFAMMEHTNKAEAQGVAIEIKENDLMIHSKHFEAALNEVKPAFGRSRENLTQYMRGGLIEYNKKSPQELLNYVEELSTAPMRSLLIHGLHGTGCTYFASYIAKLTSIPCVKWLSIEKYIDLSEVAKANILKETFKDAFTTEKSLIIIDDIEEWIDYVNSQRFSSHTYKVLNNLCRRTPLHQSMVICTTHNKQLFDTLGFTDFFSKTYELSQITTEEELTIVCQALNKPVCNLPVSIKKLVNM